MKKFIAAIALSAAIATGSAVAQSNGRSLIDVKRTWTTGGSEQTSKTIKETAVPGGKALQITSTGQNSKYSANVSYRLVGEFKQGERITMSGMVRAEKPTQVGIYVELADAPYSRIGGGTIEAGTEWKPYKVEFIAPSDRAAGVTRAIIQLNSEARTLYFGPLTVTATEAK